MLKLTKLGLHYRIGKKNKSLSKENVLAIMITTITLMIQMKTRYV
jgi:hypothetical protein